LLPFSEIGQLAGVYQTEWSWSALFADFDNDIDRDLMVTNGFPKDLTDKDFTNYKAQMYGFLIGDEEIIPRIPVVKVSNYAYENTGDATFENRTKDWGMFIPSFSNGAAFADLDNDGDLDYIVNNINDVAFVYRNNTCNKPLTTTNFLRVSLKGNAPNTLAIGSKVEVMSGGRYQFYEHHLSRGYLSSVDPVIHFGLDGQSMIDTLKITWPGGEMQTLLTQVEANQLITIEQTQAKPEARTIVQYGNALFASDTSAIRFTHAQEDYNDFFQYQRIIQHKFSQLGPCMAQGDIDGDGKDDLVIAGSATQPASVYLYTDRGFEAVQIPGLTDRRVCLEADVRVVDIDSDGDNDLVSVAGGYANENADDYKHCVYRNNAGTFVREALALPAFPASVVRQGDFDKDGDMDLFVGARVQRGNFPYAEKSFVLENQNGSFSEAATLSFDLGMVTDAVWSDIDGDGWQDLVVAREWNSIVLLRNRGGKEMILEKNDLLDSKKGFWSSVVAADLDGDGDDDYVAGNLGNNHRFHVSDQWPMKLYAVDVDNNGVIDPITAAFWKDKEGVMQEYPVNYLDELAAQSPFFRKKFQSYTQFSYTPMDSILDLHSIPPEKIYSVNTTASHILWNDNGSLVWEILPPAVQSSPVKKILVQDFNRDGHPDLLLAGNDYSYDVSTGYYDANKGIVLLGNADKKFRVLPPSKSGLVLSGQIESLLFFDGETQWIVAGVNRGEAIVYKVALGSEL
jgi:hypothetical protein